MGGALKGQVAFEVDHIDVESNSGWSVVVHGRAEDVTRFDGPGFRVRAGDPWTGPKDALLRITPTSVTGRRVGAMTATPAG